MLMNGSHAAPHKWMFSMGKQTVIVWRSVDVWILYFNLISLVDAGRMKWLYVNWLGAPKWKTRTFVRNIKCHWFIFGIFFRRVKQIKCEELVLISLHHFLEKKKTNRRKRERKEHNYLRDIVFVTFFLNYYTSFSFSFIFKSNRGACNKIFDTCVSVCNVYVKRNIFFKRPWPFPFHKFKCTYHHVRV